MLIYVVEDYAEGSEMHSVWGDLEAALTTLKLRPTVDSLAEAIDWDSPFSTVDVWAQKGSEYILNYEKYPTIYYYKSKDKFYTHFGEEAWYFDSAVEYRMKAVGALRDDLL